MFENLNWWEFLALLMIALLIFGDKLPKVIGDGLRMVRKLRMMAQNATADLSKELGTDIHLEDLHPKAFVRKHLLSEDEEDALRKPLRGLYDDLSSDIKGVRTDLKDVADSIGTGSSLHGTTARTPPIPTTGPASALPPTGPAGTPPAGTSAAADGASAASAAATPTPAPAADASVPAAGAPRFVPVHKVEAVAKSKVAETADADVT